MSLITYIPKAIGRPLGKIGYFVLRNAPELLLAGGISAGIAAVVVAANETPKAETALEISAKRKETSDNMLNLGQITEKEYAKDIHQIDLQTGLNLVQIYTPAAALEGVSIGLIIWSHCLMRKRLRAMAMAYTALNTAFAQYRNRIRATYGEDADKFGLTGVVPKQLKAGTMVDGQPIEAKKTEDILPNTISPYARYFDQYSNQWKKDMNFNLMYLRMQERWCNQMLHLKGYFFLNELYEKLGFPPTPEGQVVGWWDDPMTGDARISFGLKTGVRALEDGTGGYEHAILIDPNVDGPIYERLRTVKPELTQLITPGVRQEIGLAHPEGVQVGV